MEVKDKELSLIQPIQDKRQLYRQETQDQLKEIFIIVTTNLSVVKDNSIAL